MAGRYRVSFVLRWFVASRLIIAALGVIGVATFVNQRTGAVVDHVSALDPQTAWDKWDVLWYQRVAEQGYRADPDDIQSQAKPGYFPLYPTIVGAAQSITGATFFWIGAVASNLFTLAALLLLVYGLTDTWDLASRAVAVIMLSAGSFYLSIPYAEGLFLLLVVATLVATRKGLYEVAAFLAGLAATTKVHGFALIAVPAIACWRDARIPAARRWLRVAATGVLFALPVAVYFAYLSRETGSWTAFIARQQAWENPSPYPFQAVMGLLAHPRNIGGWIHGATWFLYAGLLIRYWRRMPPGDALFCAGALVISTQQQSFQGIYRYVVPMVPITLALAGDRDDVRRGVIGFNLVLGVVMILAFVTWNRLVV
ncbi:MAG TPA: hypothetical protein VFV78_02660 [Vicinamibacterales bacterium]|nr:hypothetical protein [Vicinamibacterales bacterium]